MDIPFNFPAMNSVILLVSLAIFQPQEEKVYQRLEKSYAKSAQKAFELANKYQKRDKTLASPYYFQEQYYEQKAENARKTGDKALALGNAAVNGVLFEKYGSETLLQRVEWTTKKATLLEKIETCLIDLKKEHQTDRRKRLLEKGKQLFPDLEMPVIEKEPIAEKEVEQSVPKVVPSSAVTSNTTVDFAKLPTGKERLPAIDATSEKELLELINKERIAKKLTPLKLDTNLVRAARYHANDMAHENYFDHDSYNRVNGKLVKVVSTFDRIRLFYTEFANTENIAAGNATADATYEQWYNSPGHYANMFNSSAKSVGIAMAHDPSSSYGYYWVFCTGY